jgi:hypothetical protein
MHFGLLAAFQRQKKNLKPESMPLSWHSADLEHKRKTTLSVYKTMNLVNQLRSSCPVFSHLS